MLRIRFAAIVLAQLLATSTVFAQAADTTEAKKLFDAGMVSYKAGQFSEALTSFKQSYKLVPRASTQRNIAQAYRAQKDMPAAYAAYEEMLATFGGTMKLVDKNEVTRALEELASITGIVSVTISEPGAIVGVDGQEAGPAPRSVRLNQGSHVVTIAKPGFDRLEQKVEIAGKDTVVVAGPLVATVKKGHVNVTVTAEAPATVVIDGVAVGAPPWSGDLDPGPHSILARTADAASRAASLDLKARDNLDVALTIDKAPAPPPPVVVPPPETKPAARTETWEGIYAQVHLLMLLGTSAQNNVSSGEVYGATGKTDSSVGVGGGIGIHVGYSFGWWGIEGIANAAYDHLGVKVKDPTLANIDDTIGRTDTWDFHRAGGTIAAGARVRGQSFFRPSAGVAFGASMKTIFFRRKAGNTRALGSTTSDATFHATPSLLADAGIEIGNPSLSFFGGMMIQADFPTATTLDNEAVTTKGQRPLPSGTIIRATTGPEFFFGPMLGARFGS